MRNQIKDLFSVWRDVFSRRKYFFLAVSVGLIFYSINVVIANYEVLLSFYGSQGFLKIINLFIALFIGFKETRPFSSIASLIIISVLLGMLSGLILYKTEMIKSSTGKTFGFFGSTGIFLGILAPGCVACGVGLLSLFGISAATLSVLPYDGLELSILSILILGSVVFKITKDINKGIVCEIK